MPIGPETSYALTADGGHVAYQVVGDRDRDIDIVFVFGWYSHVEAMWEEPLLARFLGQLALMGRVILFDQRGTGLSDPVPSSDAPLLEGWADDLVAVMEAAGSTRAFLIGAHHGGPLTMSFAATYPQRTAGLILANTFARLARAPDYPIGVPHHLLDQLRAQRRAGWGRPDEQVPRSNPSLAQNAAFIGWLARFERLAASPGTAAALRELLVRLDVRPVLPVISSPTLILHRVGCREFRVGHARYLSEHIASANLVELAGSDTFIFAGDSQAVLAEVEEFITGERTLHGAERFLSTVMFTDIVDSTARSVSVGDARWRELLDDHDATVDRHIWLHRGKRIKHTGDGVLATFDGPARAVQCALAIRAALLSLDLTIRVGLHTGEVERRGDDISGAAVHIAKRIESAAGAGEVLVSRTVVDLVVGSGLAFIDRGEHDLRGVPSDWRLFEVAVS